MALDINGYNATFKAFTDFATKNVEAGNSKAIARASADVQTGPLTGRSITAATTDSVRGLFKWFRKPDDKAANDATRKIFRDAIIDMFGGESKIPASVKKAMIMGDYDKGKPLTARRILAVKAAIDANVFKASVDGSGKAANVMRGIFQRKLGGVTDPGGQLATSLGRVANGMMNWSFCAEMKKNGVGTQFEKDIDRGCNATLTDGKRTIKLTQNFETARDELAQFVTGDDKATYGNLKPEGKSKVHMLMSLISQETEKAGENGTQYALDPREADSAFTITGYSKQDLQKGIGAKAERKYVIEKRADGGIDMHYTMDKPLKEIDDGTTDGDGYKLAEGSKFMCKMDYSLNGTEFNRLAKLDYGKFDDTEAGKIFGKKIDLPDGTRDYRERKMEKIVDSFAQEFKVNADCKMSIKYTLNPAEDE